MIIGKGNKERLICFTDRAIGWLKKYLVSRTDDHEALFVAFGSNNRMTQYDLSKLFKHYTQLSGIKKRVTPHMLRHTMATLLLRCGCNIK